VNDDASTGLRGARPNSRAEFWQLNFDSKSEWLSAIDELTTIIDHG
jgi:hypothetical protein